MGMFTVALVREDAALSLAERAQAEFAKDLWDVRNIPGARYSAHRSDHLLNFADVPALFRPAVKKLIKSRLIGAGVGRSMTHGHCAGMIRFTRDFLVFFVQRYPSAATLHPLSPSDIDAYLAYLRATPNHHGNRRSDVDIWRSVNAAQYFLRYLKRTKDALAPLEDVDTIILPEHMGKQPQHNPTAGIKFIPLCVLHRLDQHLHDLPHDYLPIVIVLRASGWRISDVLALRHDKCLKRAWDARKEQWTWSLVGDIQKTRVLDHEIPVTAEVAALIEAQIALVTRTHSSADNPERYLFPAFTRKRHGRPIASEAVAYALNRLAEQHEIRGDDGEIFRFKTHAFRHTKAVELINRGMPLVLVQKWMAHLSPEMTLVYAQILGDTMRTEWERTEAKVGVRFLDGRPTPVAGAHLKGLVVNDAFDPLRVREHRVNIKLPVGNCVKPRDFSCRFVELPCFNCPMHVLTDEDLPWLLTYELQLIERVEVGKQAGHQHWIEANQKLLDEKVRPTIALLRQGVILAREGQQVREYTREDGDSRTPQHQEMSQ